MANFLQCVPSFCNPPEKVGYFRCIFEYSGWSYYINPKMPQLENPRGKILKLYQVKFAHPSNPCSDSFTLVWLIAHFKYLYWTNNLFLVDNQKGWWCCTVGQWRRHCYSNWTKCYITWLSRARVHLCWGNQHHKWSARTYRCSIEKPFWLSPPLDRQQPCDSQFATRQ